MSTYSFNEPKFTSTREKENNRQKHQYNGKEFLKSVIRGLFE